MKSYIPFALILAALIIGGVFMFTAPKEASVELVKSTSVVTFDVPSHNFGTIDIFGGKVSNLFAITNSGPNPVTITEGTTSCGCTEAEIGGISFGMHEKMSQGYTLEAGETAGLTVTFDPLAHGPDATGKITREVFIKTDSEASPELSLKVIATVTKAASE